MVHQAEGAHGVDIEIQRQPAGPREDVLVYLLVMLRWFFYQDPGPEARRVEGSIAPARADMTERPWRAGNSKVLTRGSMATRTWRGYRDFDVSFAGTMPEYLGQDLLREPFLRREDNGKGLEKAD